MEVTVKKRDKYPEFAEVDYSKSQNNQCTVSGTTRVASVVKRIFKQKHTQKTSDTHIHRPIYTVTLTATYTVTLTAIYTVTLIPTYSVTLTATHSVTLAAIYTVIQIATYSVTFTAIYTVTLTATYTVTLRATQ
ncbi:unnamed protein product, partial [Candidula unifasciata]